MDAATLKDIADRLNKCITHEKHFWDAKASHYGDEGPPCEMFFEGNDEDEDLDGFYDDPDAQFESSPDWDQALDILNEIPPGTTLPIVVPDTPAYDYGATILHVASASNAPFKVIEKLIKVLGPEGVKERSDKCRSSPLHYAFDHQDPRVIRALAEADPESIHHKERVGGENPLERLLEVVHAMPSNWFGAGMTPSQVVIMLLKINPIAKVEYPWNRAQYDYRQIAAQFAAPKVVLDFLRHKPPQWCVLEQQQQQQQQQEPPNKNARH